MHCATVMNLGPSRDTVLLEAVGLPLVALAAWKLFHANFERRDVSRIATFSFLIGVFSALWAQSLPCLDYVCHGNAWGEYPIRSAAVLFVGPAATAVTMLSLVAEGLVSTGVPVEIGVVINA